MIACLFFTYIAFCDIFARACAGIKIKSLGFSFFFCFFFFAFSYLFTALIDLLALSLLLVKNVLKQTEIGVHKMATIL